MFDYRCHPIKLASDVPYQTGRKILTDRPGGESLLARNAELVWQLSSLSAKHRADLLLRDPYVWSNDAGEIRFYIT